MTLCIKKIKAIFALNQKKTQAEAIAWNSGLDNGEASAFSR